MKTSRYKCALGLLGVTFLLCLGFCSTAAAQPLQNPTIHLFTEYFPPLSMAVEGSASSTSTNDVTGFVVEIIKQLFARAQISYTLELVPWIRAYNLALAKPNHGVFTTTRTLDREDLFLWISPLTENKWVLMGRSDGDIELSDLGDARRFRIGGYPGDAISLYLENNGLTIDYAPQDALNVRKLAMGRIDLWPVGQRKGRWLANREGVAVKEIFTLKLTRAGLAMNKNTDPVIVARLEQELERMRADGTVSRITENFLTREDNSDVK